MKKISIIIVQTLLLIFSIYLYKIMLDERRMIKNNGTIKVFIMQVKNKGKYGIKYNVKYQDKIYYNIVGLDRNLKENSYDTQNFYYNNENNTIATIKGSVSEQWFNIHTKTGKVNYAK